MHDVFIFGTKNNAEMAKFYFERDCPNKRIIGFIEDEPEGELAFGCPVYRTADFLDSKNQHNALIFAPLTSSSGRRHVFQKFKSHGYTFANYISPSATVWSESAIGENCFVQELNNIQFGTYVGDNCLFWAGNHIGHHGVIGCHTTFTSHVVLSGGCTIGSDCYFGVNSTVGDGLTVAPSVFVGMGATVTKDIRVEGLYVGTPARRVKSSDGIM